MKRRCSRNTCEEIIGVHLLKTYKGDDIFGICCTILPFSQRNGSRRMKRAVLSECIRELAIKDENRTRCNWEEKVEKRSMEQLVIERLSERPMSNYHTTSWLQHYLRKIWRMGK